MPRVKRVHAERSDKLVRMHVAEPAPLGLVGLAIGCQILFCLDFEWTEGKVMTIPYIICMPGLLQVIAGLMDYMRHNVFGATAFVGYGFFWIGLGSMYAIEMQYETEDELKAVCFNPIRQHTGVVACGYLIFSVVLTILSLSLNRVFMAILVCIDFAFFFLIMHIFEKWTAKLLGVALVFVCIFSWYGYFAFLALKMAGGEVLPIGKPFISLKDYIIEDEVPGAALAEVPVVEVNVASASAPVEGALRATGSANTDEDDKL